MQHSQKTNGLLKLIRKIYDEVHLALWSLFIAAIVFFCAFVLPRVQQLRAEIEAERIQTIITENAYYCEKLDFPAGTHKHSRCILDLNELRAKIEQRQIDEGF